MKPNTLLASIFALATIGTACAEEDTRRSEWFKGLLQPGTEAPCCDLSDCQRTVADWHDGQWWAIVVGRWVPVPPGTVLNTHSIDGDAYVCATHYRKIYCFIRPDFGT
jgi:hypothetical protein